MIEFGHMKVRTRFAPSPTGFMHIGSLRTAIYAYALAKHNSGDFLLRIEDTDQKRQVENAIEKIYEILKEFRLIWDEKYIQSERVETGIYKKAAEKLLSDGHAFYCFCKPQTKEEIKKEREVSQPKLRDVCRNLSVAEINTKIAAGEIPAIRLKTPDNQSVKFTDFIIKKETVWNSNDVPDAMLLKSDGFPTYHLAMPVDDHDMQISHVIRAMEWFSSTPIHVLMFEYLGFPMPEFGHPTAILDPAGGKLSKRKGNVSVEEFISEGYLKEAILNFVILLGWAPKDNREMFTLQEFVEAFDPNGFQKSNPIFNIAKLNWFNQQYIKKLSDKELFEELKLFTVQKDFEKLIPLVRDRLVTLKDFDNLTDYFFAKPTIDKEIWAKLPHDPQPILDMAVSVLTENFDGKFLEDKARAFCAEKNIKVGDFFMTLRLAITGRTATPPLWDVMSVLGKEETLARLKI